MSNSTQGKTPDQHKQEDEGMLEKIANTIDPAGTGVTDDEILDPGANIRDFPPDQKKENRNPPNQK